MEHFKSSLLQRILIPLLLVMLIEGLLLCIVVFNSGTMEGLKGNAYDVFNEKVSGRKDNLQNEMTGHWSAIEAGAASAEEKIAAFEAEHDIGVKELKAGDKTTELLLEELSEDVIYTLRKNTVTGAFIILDSDGADKKAGLYFKDTDPNTEASDNSDIQAFRGPSGITKKLDIALDAEWLPFFPLEQESESDGYYYVPFGAAQAEQGMGRQNLGYWCPSSQSEDYESGKSSRFITYSVPLYANGVPCGVMGVDLSVEYLEKQFPARELSEDNYGSYVLAWAEEGSGEEAAEYRIIAKSGALLSQMTDLDGTIKLENESYRQNFHMLSEPWDSTCLCP